jgi:hypothetical protein
MVLVTVKLYREFPYYYDEYSVDSKLLGEKWCSFFIKTNFCRILPYRRVVNNTTRLGYNGFVYIVDANSREMVYNSNYEIDDEVTLYVRDMVDYVLGKYKHRTIKD